MVKRDISLSTSQLLFLSVTYAPREIKNALMDDNILANKIYLYSHKMYILQC